MQPIVGWIDPDLGAMITALVTTVGLGFIGFRRGLFVGIVAVLAVLTGLGASVALAPRMANSLIGLGWSPGFMLPVSYFLILFLTLWGAHVALGCLVREDDLWLARIADRAGGAFMGGLAGLLLGGALLVGWSMCEVPAGVRVEKPRRSGDIGAWALQVFSRLAELRTEDRERLLGGDVVRGGAAEEGNVILATEPFDDVDADRRHGEDERFIDYDDDGKFTTDQQIHDHSTKGVAQVRDTGLLDRYWLSAWRRMLVLHPPEVISKTFGAISHEAGPGGFVYQVEVNDPDPDKNFRYSLKDGDDDDARLLTIDQGTGAVELKSDASPKELEAIVKRGNAKFTVIVEDASGLTKQQTITVTLRPSNMME